MATHKPTVNKNRIVPAKTVAVSDRHKKGIMPVAVSEPNEGVAPMARKFLAFIGADSLSINVGDINIAIKKI